jgi:hypothetical protein
MEDNSAPNGAKHFNTIFEWNDYSARFGSEIESKNPPYLKASIERYFKTVNTDLFHVTPGTSFSNFLFERSATELGELAVRPLPGEQAEEAPALSVGDGIAQSDVPLPPMVEGVTIPGGEENVEAGAKLPEPEKGRQKQNTSKEDSITSNTSKISQVSTEPDEDTSFGIVIG